MDQKVVFFVCVCVCGTFTIMFQRYLLLEEYTWILEPFYHAILFCWFKCPHPWFQESRRVILLGEERYPNLELG